VAVNQLNGPNTNFRWSQTPKKGIQIHNPPDFD
jgi:hypothetical protein